MPQPGGAAVTVPTRMAYIIGGSGIVPAALLDILLNIVLPQDKD